MKIEEHVNSEGQESQFLEIPFENRKNIQSQIVVCDARLIFWKSNLLMSMCGRKPHFGAACQAMWYVYGKAQGTFSILECDL